MSIPREIIVIPYSLSKSRKNHAINASHLWEIPFTIRKTSAFKWIYAKEVHPFYFVQLDRTKNEIDHTKSKWLTANERRQHQIAYSASIVLLWGNAIVDTRNPPATYALYAILYCNKLHYFFVTLIYTYII